MNKNRKSQRIAMLASTILWSGLCAPALGQVASPPPAMPAGISPIRPAVDENGVDLGNGGFELSVTDLTIGPDGPAGLQHKRHWVRSAWHDGFAMFVMKKADDLTHWHTVVAVGGRSFTFTDGTQGFGGGGPYVSEQGNGATLVGDGTGFTLTLSDGTAVLFDKGQLDPSALNGYDIVVPALYSLAAVGTKISYPNGEKVSFAYKRVSLSGSFINAAYLRLQSVNSNRGYQLKYKYASNDPYAASGIGGWTQISKITGINYELEYCDPAADDCALVQSWPAVTYVVTPGSISPPANSTSTDSLGRTSRYTYDPSNNHLVGIKPPSSATDTVSVSYAPNTDIVSSLTRAGFGTWTYAASSNAGITTITRTDPLGHQRITATDSLQMVKQTDTDELLRTTTTAIDSLGRVTRITAPEGNYTQFTYDARGNVIQTRNVAKTGSGLADIVTSATFPASCANPVTCNQPTSTTDAKGNVTDYSYDPVHGGVLSVTAPAAVAGGVRPQTRIGYTAFGTNPPLYLPTNISACRTASSCAGTADEVRTTIGYGSGATDKFLPTSVTRGAGDGALSATTAMSYDSVGNLLTVDGPLPGSGDTSRTRYDIARQVVGAIGPDPDGAGPRVPIAQRFTYNEDGKRTLSELGNVVDQSDSAWAAFASQQQVATSYDVAARPVRQELKAGGATYAVTQTSYDALGRVDCVAQRMDPAQWATQAIACTPQTNGPNGPDRITRTVYDAAGEVIKLQTGYGTADQADEASLAYSANGRQASLVDGEGNKTGYGYDGFDRLSTISYPHPTAKGLPNPADFERLTYDANGNVTQRRLRDGGLQNFAYDSLDRVTLKDVPNTAYFENDISYSYDNLGRTLAAYKTGIISVSFAYDALGRETSETSIFGTKTMEYDLANRMTRLIWPDGFYANYDYDYTDNVVSIRENGVGSGIGILGTYSYDDLGRRTRLTRGNGTVTNYGFDPVSRLSSLTQDLAGTASDLTIDSLAYNPASQIAAQTRSNDAYTWRGHSNVNRSYAANGLNQITTAGATALGYDGRGNLSSSDALAFQYTSDNLLATTNAGAYVANDPLGRIAQVYANGGANVTPMDYVGGALISEMDGSNRLIRRYVFGPGEDEPLVWYEGAGTGDRRWLHADERGSIIAVSDASGAAIGINAYDEYGVPAASNLGRFQYTGQAYLPELGMYNYKARIYDPKLGRFMQTDPLGYAAGVNLYNYVGSDPVNLVDPDGLFGLDITVTGYGSGEFSFDTSFGDLVGAFSGVGFGFGGIGAVNATPNKPVMKPGMGQQKKKQSNQDPICTALVGGGVVELGSLAFGTVQGIFKGATIAELFFEGAAAATGIEGLFVLAGGIAGTYALDKLTNGKVSQTLGKFAGCSQ